MTRYEENLEILAEAYPQMDVLIEEAKKNLEPELEIIEEVSYDGETILKIKKDNRICYLNGKRNTKESAQIWRETLGELQVNAPVFIMGLGNHTYLQDLVENTKNRIAIVIYEPSVQIILKFLETVSLKGWMEKHTIVFWVRGIEGMDEKAMEKLLKRIIRYEMLPYSRKLVLPNYDILFPEETIDFLRMVRDIAKTEIIQYNTQMLFSTVMVKNLLSNIRYFCDGYKTTQLVDVIPRDIPGIVVAAGPSLNKNIKELKKAKGRAFIIAVDTAIKPLLAEGIIPDMFAIIDGKKEFKLVQDERAREIPLLSTINANSDVLDYHTGMKFFYNEGFLIAERIFRKSKMRAGNVDSGGSVATNAFSLLYKLGFTRIILVGQDLAYTNNKSHADGTFETVMEEKDTRNYIMVEGNVEEKVPTIANLKSYLEWYDYYIRNIQERNPDFRVINATEGGAKIKNTEIMSLHDAIQQECTKEVDIQECFKKLSPMLDAESKLWAEEYLREIPSKFKTLAVDAGKAKKTYQKLDKISRKKNLDTKEYLSILKKIKKANHAIEANEIYQLVASTMVNAQYILWNEQFQHEDSVNEEGKEIARKGILYAENVKKMAELFQEYAEELYKDIGGKQEQML